MAIKPILFSGPMICALLDGRKTQTRRVLSLRGRKGFFQFQPSDTPGYDWTFRRHDHVWEDYKHERLLELLPYKVGDLLWVREHWKAGAAYDDLAPSEMGGEEALKYLADHHVESWGWTYDPRWGRHRQAMHMPRWASRLTLRVTDVRVQRVQEISEEDARAEGCEAERIGMAEMYALGSSPRFTRSAKNEFRDIWDSLNAKRGFGWDVNPFVAAYTFEVIYQNVDEVAS